MSTLAETQPDQSRIVANLAKEFQQTVVDVGVLYEHERAELALGAHITKFLHIFAIRNVQQILRKRAVDNSESLARVHQILAVQSSSGRRSLHRGLYETAI